MKTLRKLWQLLHDYDNFFFILTFGAGLPIFLFVACKHVEPIIYLLSFIVTALVGCFVLVASNLGNRIVRVMDKTDRSRK